MGVVAKCMFRAGKRRIKAGFGEIGLLRFLKGGLGRAAGCR